MATSCLFQPPLAAGLTSQSLRKDVSASSSLHPSTAVVSSASHLKVEAASMCSSASLKTQGCGQLVSQFWSTDSKRGLLERPNTSEMACRPGSLSVVEARLFGPAIFEAAKLKVLFLGADKKHPEELPRIYTLTHSDVTSKITLAISREINKAQLKGWYSKLQRDEVVAEWRKVQGKMTLHVHCHISGGNNVLHNMIANLRFYIFRKELPVVLEAFRHGDEELLKAYPDLDNSLVWVYFHSNVREYNRLECWGPLVEAAKVSLKFSIPNCFPRVGGDSFKCVTLLHEMPAPPPCHAKKNLHHRVQPYQQTQCKCIMKGSSNHAVRTLVQATAAS